MTTLRERIAAATHSPDPNVRIDAVERLVEQETATLMDTLAKRSAALDRVTARLDDVRALAAEWVEVLDGPLAEHATPRDLLTDLRDTLDNPAEDER